MIKHGVPNYISTLSMFSLKLFLGMHCVLRWCPKLMMVKCIQTLWDMLMFSCYLVCPLFCWCCLYALINLDSFFFFFWRGHNFRQLITQQICDFVICLRIRSQLSFAYNIAFGWKDICMNLRQLYYSLLSFNILELTIIRVDLFLKLLHAFARTLNLLMSEEIIF